MMTLFCPTGMIFVPSVGDRSHNSTEHTKPKDIEAGANVLLQIVLELVVALGRNTKTDIPDLLIGISGKAARCETTLTFEKRLEPTGLFERIGPAVRDNEGDCN